MKNKISCKDCMENRCSKGIQEMYAKKAKCVHCDKVIGYRKPTKKEKTNENI